MNEQATWQFDNPDVTIRAVHEAGHAVVGHVIGRLIEEVSIVSDKTIGYKGYCRFSALVEAANDHYPWQEASKNPDHITINYAGTAAVEIICKLHGWDYQQLRRGDADDRAVIT